MFLFDVPFYIYFASALRGSILNEAVFSSRVRGTYKSVDLRRWRPAPVVEPVPGRPGELGKAVHIPSENEAMMKEQFKINQFNLMASDIISLNRSLTDVRLEG